jgi:hypothetical protein
MNEMAEQRFARERDAQLSWRVPDFFEKGSIWWSGPVWSSNVGTGNSIEHCSAVAD